MKLVTISPYATTIMIKHQTFLNKHLPAQTERNKY